MALTSDEARRVTNHLHALEFRFPELFVGRDLAAILADATADQQTSIREVLPVADRLRTELGTVDQRFLAARLGKIELNPREWPQRMTQYDWHCIQLGAVLAYLEPDPGYAVATDPPRGW